jgi:hypothetical protein
VANEVQKRNHDQPEGLAGVKRVPDVIEESKDWVIDGDVKLLV